ncbi:MAG TPA: TlpA disulfide reductase family protein [Ktedonobacteraceae bacterium]|nr:TlpA disulfide reductase family protein [Ktedonobacteraceae bacterium]
MKDTNDNTTENTPSEKSRPLFKQAFLNSMFGPSLATLLIRSAILIVAVGTVVILIVGLLLPATTGANQSQNGAAGVVGWKVGNQAPNFTLQTPDGRKLSLSDFRGKPVLLNFWYATCPGCLTEVPDLQSYYASQKQAGKDFTTLGVNILDSATDTQSFVQQHHVSYPVLLDQNQQVMTLYHINATPTSYFIDRQGMIRAVVVSPLNTSMIQTYSKQIESGADKQAVMLH